MATPLELLVVDFQAESRFLLVKTLRRKFPDAVIYETDDVETATQHVRSGNVTAAVTHRTFDVDGAEIVRRLRGLNPELIIVMVSGMDRSDAAVSAGATCFLPYEQWLRVGSLVEEHLCAGNKATAAAVTAPAGSV